METRYVKVPFDVELAKKITEKSVEGRIVTRDGRSARIVCFDMKSDNCIVAIIQDESEEYVYPYPKNGLIIIDRPDDLDLVIEIPEYMTFKDGDIVTLGWEENGKHCIWVSIIKSLSKYDKIETESYVSVCLSADETSVFPLLFDEFQSCAMWARKSTEIEEKEIINELKASKEPKSKEYLKLFFGIEQKQECEFKPFDKVMVRDYDDCVWKADIFLNNSDGCNYMCTGNVVWAQCIPYNEKTAHLLGTTEDYKDE